MSSEVCHYLNMKIKEFCLRGRIFTNTLKRKHELCKVTVQPRKDSLRLRWKWTEKVGKDETNQQLESQRLELYQAKQWANQAQRENT